ncbi:MAG: TetR/AcrR family transcriptional regulator [Burkholderiaceae bacterium]|nr:TetR/AcrR family transcriptional regulator [Burkholderiaceae bacterium]
MPKSRKPSAARSSAAPRQPLTRERIADAALALIDEVGLEGFSMRPLGQRLGVEAMALYHHFPGKGELLDAVMDRLLDETELPPRGQMPPLERLRRFVHSYRACAIHHPRAFPLLAARRFNTAPSLALYERVLVAFADLGLDAAESARWFRLIGGFASGAGLAEGASRERISDPTPLRLERDPAGPDLADLPHVRAVAPHLRVDQLDAVFEFGVGVLFDALAAHAAANSPATAPR